MFPKLKPSILCRADYLAQDSETVVMGQEPLLCSTLLHLSPKHNISPFSHLSRVDEEIPRLRESHHLTEDTFVVLGRFRRGWKLSGEPESVGEAEQVVKRETEVAVLRKGQCDLRLEQGGNCSLILQESSGPELICLQ